MFNLRVVHYAFHPVNYFVIVTPKHNTIIYLVVRFVRSEYIFECINFRGNITNTKGAKIKPQRKKQRLQYISERCTCRGRVQIDHMTIWKLPGILNPVENGRPSV